MTYAQASAWVNVTAHLLSNCFALGVIASHTSRVHADIWRYVDESGVEHYTNYPHDGKRGLELVGPPPKAEALWAWPDAGEVCSREDAHRYDKHIREAAILYVLPEDFIRAVMEESGFHPNFVSACGAVGLMQVQPVTAAEMGATDALDPRQNVLTGARYLRVLANRSAGDQVRTLLAYRKTQTTSSKCRTEPLAMRYRYVRRVIATYDRYRAAAEAPAFANYPAVVTTVTARLEGQAVYSQLHKSVWMVSTPDGTGSAVAVSSSDLVTNAHVVSKLRRVVTLRRDGVEQAATVIALDMKRDLAILRAASGTLTPVQAIRSYASVSIGEPVFCLGYPLLEETFTDGLVSSKPRLNRLTARLIQTTAPISPGSSGGGLFDGAGNLIGISTGARSGQSRNVSISAEDVFRLAPRRGA